METWKDIPGTDYSVSDEGRVASRKKGGWRILKPSPDGGGYPFVTIFTGGRGCARKVHRLVAEAFLGPSPTPLHEINHIDGVRGNGRAANLEWVTHRENVDHYVNVLYPVALRNTVAKALKSAKRPIDRKAITLLATLYGEKGSWRKVGACLGANQGDCVHVVKGRRRANAQMLKALGLVKPRTGLTISMSRARAAELMATDVPDWAYQLLDNAVRRYDARNNRSAPAQP